VKSVIKNGIEITHQFMRSKNMVNPEMRTDRLRDYLKLLCQEIETAASMIEDKTVSEYLKKLSETYKGKLYE